ESRACVCPAVLPALVRLPRPASERWPRRPPRRDHRGAAGHILVVARALVGVGQRGVRRVQPDEPLVAACACGVRVHVPRQAPVRRLDLAPAGPHAHPEHLVVRPPSRRSPRQHAPPGSGDTTWKGHSCRSERSHLWFLLCTS
uniref:Uncharacterized protein n=1 Tax=Triticum urartu TaxID=4572 RepID=A0A8R7RAM8_TRIUA